MTGKVKLRLNHNCGLKGAEGMPGQIVEVDEKLADKILARKGGKLVSDDGVETAKSAPVPSGSDLVEHVRKLTDRVSAMEHSDNASVVELRKLLSALAMDVEALKASVAKDTAKGEEASKPSKGK